MISPDGTRVPAHGKPRRFEHQRLRATIFTTNIVNASATGGSAANTNFIFVGQSSGTFTIDYNFYSVPDEMTVYASTNPADFYLANPTFICGYRFNL